MELTHAALRGIVEDEHSFARGRNYFRRGHVRDVVAKNVSPMGVRVSGRVHGSQVYRVSFDADVKNDVITSYRCSCPYDWGGACKHVVALGLAYIERGPDIIVEPSPSASSQVDSSAPDRTRQILEQFLRANHIDATQKSIEDLAEQLARIQAGEGARPSKPKLPMYQHYGLDRIHIVVLYEQEQDRLCLKSEVTYGTQIFPLCSADVPEEGEELRAKGRRVVYRILREWEVEWDCVQEIGVGKNGASPDKDGKVFVNGDDIYWFVKDVLPGLVSRYDVEIDDSARHVVEVDQEDVASEWKTTSTGIDFLDFEVALHCANAHLTLEQLEEMVAGHRPYVRREDGSFVECSNLEEAEEWLTFLKSATSKGDGRFAAKLFRVPEMLHLIERVGSSRWAVMDGYVKAFLKETKDGRPIEPVSIPKRLSSILRPYQKQGIEWGAFLRKYHFGGILADDMGLGKTLQALVMLSLSHRKEKIGRPSIVVCPKTLIHTWVSEAAKFTSELKTLAIEGNFAERKALFEKIPEADLVVTSYPLMLRDIKAYIDARYVFRYCILDEAQQIKNSQSDTAQAVKLISAEYRLALTGTPIENGVHELWSIFDFLMPGFLGDMPTFRSRFQRPIQEKHDTEALTRLQAKIKPFVLRRTKVSELKDLPAKIEQVRSCSLTPEQLVLYMQTMEAVRHDVIRAVERKGFKHAHIEILAALMRLRQVCNHPALVLKKGKKDPHLSGKMPHALEIIQEARAGGHKVLVFSSFTSMLDIIRETLNEHKIGHCTIEGKTRDRAAQVVRFCEDSNAHVFLLSLKAGGVGLTLTAADTVIIFDPWWNPMAEAQAMDRAHRIGQKKTVNVYKLITQGTIEERVLELQKRKRKLFDALMTENSEALDALTWDDVKELFEM